MIIDIQDNRVKITLLMAETGPSSYIKSLPSSMRTWNYPSMSWFVSLSTYNNFIKPKFPLEMVIMTDEEANEIDEDFLVQFYAI